MIWKRTQQYKRSRKLQRTLAALLATGVVVLPLALLALVPSELTMLKHARSAVTAAQLPAFQARSVDSAQPVRLFNEPLITVSFDGGWQSTYTLAAPLLNKYGIHGTQYLVSGSVGRPQYMNLAEIKSLAHAGSEIACQTVTHPDLTKVSAAELARQLNGCAQYFAPYFGTITDFASPYGASNATTLAAIAGVYQSQRNTGGDLSHGVQSWDVNQASNFDPYNITSIAVGRSTTLAQLHAAVDYTVAHNGWLVLTYQQIGSGGAQQFSVSQKNLQAQLAYLSSTPVRIVTTHQVISDLAASQ